MRALPNRENRQEQDFRFVELLLMVGVLVGIALIGVDYSLAGIAPFPILPVEHRLATVFSQVLTSAGVVALFAYFLHQRGETWKEWGFSRSEAEDYILGLGMGILIWGAWYFVGNRAWNESILPQGGPNFPDWVVHVNLLANGFAYVVLIVCDQFAVIFVLRELKAFTKSSLFAAGFVIAIHVAAAAPETLRQAGGALIGGAVIPLYYLRFGRMMPALVASAVATVLWLTIH